jgi:hypothetical protein
MILTAIIVTALVFTGLGAAIGYVLGYIEAENFYRIQTRRNAAHIGATSLKPQQAPARILARHR